MSKVCTVCGKEIKLLDRAVKLKHTKINFCADCCDEAEALFNVVNSTKPDDFNRRYKDEFYETLAQTKYSTFIKSCIKDEFLSIIATQRGRKLVIKKEFDAGFDEVYSKLLRLGNELSFDFFKPEKIIVNNVITTTFTFELTSPVYRGNWVVAATVVTCGEKTTLTTHSSGGFDGIDDMEIHLLNKFWLKFRELEKEWFIKKEIEPEVRAPGKIGILGGSFDPIHLGHKSLGEAAIKELNLKKLIVMPAKIQPFKKDKQVTPAHQRKLMAELAFIGNDKVDVSDYEIEKSEVSYTYDTLTYLKQYFPDDQLYFILGTDSFIQIEKWYKGIELLENFSFAVSTRPGYREKELEDTIKKYKEKYSSEVVKIESNMPDISSTEIRQLIKDGKSVEHLIPYSVERYIKENELYM